MSSSLLPCCCCWYIIPRCECSPAGKPGAVRCSQFEELLEELPEFNPSDPVHSLPPHDEHVIFRPHDYEPDSEKEVCYEWKKSQEGDWREPGEWQKIKVLPRDEFGELEVTPIRIGAYDYQQCDFVCSTIWDPEDENNPLGPLMGCCRGGCPDHETDGDQACCDLCLPSGSAKLRVETDGDLVLVTPNAADAGDPCNTLLWPWAYACESDQEFELIRVDNVDPAVPGACGPPDVHEAKTCGLVLSSSAFIDECSACPSTSSIGWTRWAKIKDDSSCDFEPIPDGWGGWLRVELFCASYEGELRWMLRTCFAISALAPDPEDCDPVFFSCRGYRRDGDFTSVGPVVEFESNPECPEGPPRPKVPEFHVDINLPPITFHWGPDHDPTLCEETTAGWHVRFSVIPVTA